MKYIDIYITATAVTVLMHATIMMDGNLNLFRVNTGCFGNIDSVQFHVAWGNVRSRRREIWCCMVVNDRKLNNLILEL